MGSYGDRRVIETLTKALFDRDAHVAGSALHALFYLSLYFKDPVIGDAVVRYLDGAVSRTSIETALNILKEIDEPRRFEVALRFLDDPATGDPAHMLKFICAFCVAETGRLDAIQALLSRLSSEDAGVRAAAVGALRHAARPDNLEPIKTLLSDPDQQVRFQAEMTMRFLEHPAIEVSDSDLAPVRDEILQQMRAMGIDISEPNEDSQ